MTWNPGQPNVKMTRIEDEKFPQNPGEFAWKRSGDGTRYLSFRDNRGMFHCVPVTPASEGKQPNNWLWDGNEDSPTLVPSILAYGEDRSQVKWHGYVTGGEVGFEC